MSQEACDEHHRQGRSAFKLARKGSAVHARRWAGALDDVDRWLQRLVAGPRDLRAAPFGGTVRRRAESDDAVVVTVDPGFARDDLDLVVAPTA